MNSTEPWPEQIEVKGVSRRNLRGVSFCCPAHRVTVLMGPSGSGKSTLLRMVAGLESPDTGTIILGGRPPADRQKEGEVGLAFQDPTLLPWRTVRKNIELPLQILRRKDFSSVDRMINMTKLRDYSSSFPGELSGGQEQRTALARALVTRPRFLLLDEPFNGLDYALRQQLNSDLRAWLAELRTTTILVTHDPEDAILFADQIVVLGGDKKAVKVILDEQVPESADFRTSWPLPEVDSLYRRVLAALEVPVDLSVAN